MEIYPSLISSDLLNLEDTINKLEPHVDGYHIDVMDNHFVPNLTWGFDFVNSIAKKTKLPLCIHLMVDNPKSWLDKLELSPKDFFVFHYEALNKEEINDFLELVKKKGVKVGISIKPSTPVESVYTYNVDQIIIMSVNPGKSGQKFIDSTVPKLDALVKYKKEKNADFIVCMDGGINETNIKMLSDKGLERAAIASAIFYKDNPVLAVENLKKLL